MATKPFLMGAELECSMSSPRRGARGWRAQLHDRLLEAIRAEHRWLPDCHASNGVYLENGMRYYLDSGDHNEFCTPEVFTPRQIAVYDRAIEQILLKAMARIASERSRVEVCVTKNNINFHMPDRAAWGQHEAYMCWISLGAAAKQLIPHLASRVPYAGAGCLSSHPKGIGFELSQRARHMTRPTGAETTHDRAIFCTRAWKPTDVSEVGWTRTNLISKDSQRCSFGMYLSYGVTGLLMMIANEGHKIGRGVALQDPVAAMRAFSLDPWLQTKVPLANGKAATAIDIQRAYFREAKPHIESGKYPDWTAEVFDHWAATLDQLEDDPLTLADRLDPYLKLAIFDHQLNRVPMNWVALRCSLETLDRMRSIAPEPVVRALLDENPGEFNVEHKEIYDYLARSDDLKRADKEPLRMAVRLQALELNYHELGGLFDKMASAGFVDPVVVTAEEVDHAIHNPPDGGRAEVRGKAIAEYHGRNWMCDWQHLISHEEKKWVDLSDPFSRKREVLALGSDFQGDRRLWDVSRLIRRIRE